MNLLPLFSRNLLLKQSVGLLRQYQVFSLIMMSGFSIILLAGRIWLTGSGTFLFLSWNLFLALVPFAISLSLPAIRNRYFFASVFCIWLLFLPNAPYILTDLYHFKYRPDMPHWYDLFLILSFAATGLLSGLFSMNRMHLELKARLNKFRAWLMIPVIAYTTGFGIYLGRFKRWNSWDFIHHPENLLADVLDRFLHPTDHPRTWGVTLIFGTMLLMLHFAFYYQQMNLRAHEDRHGKP